MFPFSLLTSVAFVGFTMVSFPQIGLSVARVCVFFPFCLLYLALLYCIWSLSSISTSREVGFDSLEKLAG